MALRCHSNYLGDKMKATIVTDIGYGDAGKGTTVDFIARQEVSPVIVRFNGGAQAAHNVVTPEGKHHTFSQFGSGSFVKGARTFLSRFVLLDPYSLQNEARGLESLGVPQPLSRMYVDGEALVVTPFQKAANRVREVLRGKGRHGSVGMGIGETMADMIAFPHLAVRARDLRHVGELEQKCRNLQELKFTEFGEKLVELMSQGVLHDELRLLTDPSASKVVAREMVSMARQFSLVSMKTLERLSYKHSLIFEGAQGVLIDEWHGFHPYTTWSTATNANANLLLAELSYPEIVKRIGVVRAYATRHGPGPFPSEDDVLTKVLPDMHNGFGAWQGGFRVGWFDIPLTRYALAVSDGIDSLALTHLDRFAQLKEKHVVEYYKVAKSSLTKRERKAVVVDKKASKGDEWFITSFRKKEDLEDLTYQEMLGAIVEKATPVYKKVEETGEAFADYLQRKLSLPVTITSYGPTAVDKRQSAELQKAA